MSLKQETKLLRRLPKNRTYDQVLNHYKVEKELADRLKRSTREERKKIYETMYEELFSKVPDHSRLQRRNDAKRTRQVNQIKIASVKSLLKPDIIFAEYGAGDCLFAYEVCKYVGYVYGIDISDQRRKSEDCPPNFQLILYDGYDLSVLKDKSVNVLFSDQLLEHIHPEDIDLHLQNAYRILKNNGVYTIRTPHAFGGPYDVSRYFSEVPEGFHLKEWTYCEIVKKAKETGFKKIRTFWGYHRIVIPVPFVFFGLYEKILGQFPRKIRCWVSTYLCRSITVSFVKQDRQII